MADAEWRGAGLTLWRVLFGLAPIMLLAGCVTPPQTPDALRTGVRGGAMLTQMKTADIDRPLSAVFSSIKANADKCLNVTIVGSTPGTYGPVVESVTYRSSSRMIGGKGETLLQQDKRATGQMPPGGYYVLVADAHALAGQRSRVTIYGASVGYDEVFEAILTWGKGRPHECPAIAGLRAGRQYRYHNR